MEDDYFKRHLEFLTKNAFLEIREALSKTTFSEEVRPYLTGLPQFIFTEMYIPYFRDYLTREDVVKAYKTMTHEAQEKDIIRVLDFYKRGRLKSMEQEKERMRVRKLN